METADKDDEQGCMRAVERGLPRVTVCVRVCVCIVNLKLHIIGREPLSPLMLFAPVMKRPPLWTLALVFYEVTQYGGNIEQCCASGALQDRTSHLSALFSWWDVFKRPRHSYEAGSSFMFMAVAFLGRCILLLLIIITESCRLPPSLPAQACDDHVFETKYSKLSVAVTDKP